jgi:hypothetical protein
LRKKNKQFPNHKELDTYDYLKQASKIHKDLHDLGYVNGDAKLQNFVLGNDEKIRLIDLDSVTPIEKFHHGKPHTSIYSDLWLRSDSNPNKKKIDIYSIAVSALFYELDSSKLKKDILSIDFKNELDARLKSDLTKSVYRRTTDRMKDKSLGKVIEKMLSGKYESFDLVLNDLEKLQTVKDKKSLKNAISQFKNETHAKKILELFRQRSNELSNSGSMFSKYKVTRIDQLIAKRLKRYGAPSDLVEKFSNGTFPKISMTITEKALDRQRIKNLQSSPVVNTKSTSLAHGMIKSDSTHQEGLKNETRSSSPDTDTYKDVDLIDRLYLGKMNMQKINSSQQVAPPSKSSTKFSDRIKRAYFIRTKNIQARKERQQQRKQPPRKRKVTFEKD